MPNCYVLIAKDPEVTNLKHNAQFIAIDERMCEHFGVTPDDEKWYCDWENWIGVSLATGKTWEDLKELHKDSTNLPVIEWLAEHYDVDCWYQVRR